MFFGIVLAVMLYCIYISYAIVKKKKKKILFTAKTTTIEHKNILFTAIPNGLIQLIHNLLSFGSNERIFPELKVDGIEIFNLSCNNKHIRQILQSKHKISPRRKLFWDAKMSDIYWKTTWSNPYKFCIFNQVKEVHFKMYCHKMYPSSSNSWTLTTLVVSATCMFYKCDLICLMLVPFSFCKDINYMLSLKDDICTYSHKSEMIEYFVNIYILQGKYCIHKQKFAKHTPKCILFFYQKWKLGKRL